jgi:hypothetical protein
MHYLFVLSWAWLGDEEPHTLIGNLKDCQAVWNLLHKGTGQNNLAFSRITPAGSGEPAHEYLCDPALHTTEGGGLE